MESPPPPTYLRACSVVTAAITSSHRPTSWCSDPSLVVSVVHVLSQRSFDVVKTVDEFDLLLRGVHDALHAKGHVEQCANASCASFAKTARQMVQRMRSMQWRLGLVRRDAACKNVLALLFAFVQSSRDCAVACQTIPRKLIVFLFDQATFDLQTFWVPSPEKDVHTKTDRRRRRQLRSSSISPKDAEIS